MLPMEKTLNTRFGTDEDEQSLREVFTPPEYEVTVAKDYTIQVGNICFCASTLTFHHAK